VSRLDLPDNEWAELCSPRKVSDRRRRAYLTALSDSTAAAADSPQIPNPHADKPGQPLTIPDPRRLTGEQSSLQFHAMDLLVMCFVKAWSFEQPVTLEAIEDLDAGSKDALISRCFDLMPEMMPDYGPDDGSDPKAPTSVSSVPLTGSSTEAPTFATLSTGGTS